MPSRWVALPGDPPALRRWLAAQDGGEVPGMAAGGTLMDPAKQRAIEACGNCGQPRALTSTRPAPADDLELFAALGGACPRFTVSDAAVIYQKYLAISDHREPARKPGRIGKRPLCADCGHRHLGACVLHPGPAPKPDTASRGAAKAREALARRQEPEES